MIKFLKKYKAFVYGLLIHRILVIILLRFDFIHIDNSSVLANTLSFIFSWLLISLPIQYFSFLKQNKAISLKLVALFFIFLAIIINDINSKIIDNPITFAGLIFIGISFFSIIAPSYFKKHALIIIGFYILAFGYFYYIRIYIDDINRYFQQEKEIKIILVAPFFVMLLMWSYQQWKWFKIIKSEKSKAELSLLKSQINPHFFFNTLNNLYGLVIEKSDDAPNVVLKLSDMMRYTIYMGKEDLVSLKDEIAYLKNYIELHKIRYQKKVDIVFNHSQDAGYQIAPLLFIIPLENAFKHGVERLTENAFIHININVDKGIIDFDIENNFEEPETSKTIGIGVDNLKQRLELLYPNKHKIQIEIKDDLYKLTVKIEAV
ncbi:sensor histidine kinase [Pedobacter insulae]|uniref:Histidine kinase n=1 Tax=Pedobacter insulae TaxID=414048 RepID=A0A1I3A2R2_9SPHI|nr:sensor histidine kinase [Pedobacter insulae]SFH44039.1 Histidine kinase [Pedobacter insulae]